MSALLTFFRSADIVTPSPHPFRLIPKTFRFAKGLTLMHDREKRRARRRGEDRFWRGTMAGLPMDQRDGWIWFDGELKPWKEAKVHVLTHGLHYASSVFEGERAYGG